MRLEGKAALVTGAASGIGLATARRFAAEGARVTAVDADGVRLADALSGIDDVVVAAADVSRSDAVEAAFATHDEGFGGLDILVTAAGIPFAPGAAERGDLEEITDADFARVVEVNLYGTFYCVRAAVRRMRAQGRGGSIVTISSVGALLNFPLPVPYPASKAGVLGLTRAAAARLGPDNIRVNSVAPGATDTPMLPPPGSEARQAVIDLGWIRRAAPAEEMANTILFLASDEAAFITGQTVSPNGGAYM